MEGFCQCSDALKGKAKRGLSSEPISFSNPGTGAFADLSTDFRGSEITTFYKVKASSLNLFLLLYPSPNIISNSSHLHLQCYPSFAHSCPSPLPLLRPSHHQLSPRQLQRWTVFHCKPDHNASPLKTLQRLLFPLGINLSSLPWPTVPTYLGP